MNVMNILHKEERDGHLMSKRGTRTISSGGHFEEQPPQLSFGFYIHPLISNNETQNCEEEEDEEEQLKKQLRCISLFSDLASDRAGQQCNSNHVKFAPCTTEIA